MPGFNINDEISTSDYGPSPTTETVRNHRWYITIPTMQANTVLKFHARNVGRPEVETDRVTIYHGVNEIYIPAKYRWSPIDITFYDVITSEYKLSAVLYYWWAKIMQDVDRHKFNKDGISAVSDPASGNMIADNSTNYKRNINIELLNGRGQQIYEYVLYGAWPSLLSASALDYTNSEIGEVTVRISYDHAKLIDYRQYNSISDTFTTDPLTGKNRYISPVPGSITGTGSA